MLRTTLLLKLFGATILYLVTNVGVSYLVAAVYAYLVNPGQPDQHYLDWAVLSAPYSSVVAGMPLMFLLGWWVCRWKSVANGVSAMLVVWLMYVGLDLSIIGLSGGMTRRLAVFVVISLLTKLIAGQLGVRFEARSTLQTD